MDAFMCHGDYPADNYPTFDMDGSYFHPTPTAEEIREYEEFMERTTNPPTFPNDTRRPNMGPPKMMRCAY